MKKFIPIILAIITFITVLIFLSPPAETKVVVAATDLQMGHVLTASDLVIKSYPKEVIPGDVVTDPGSVIGLTMLISRPVGDILRTSSVGVQSISLKPDERAVAITVDNASGMAGLLRPGDLVGISAIISVQNYELSGTYSKIAIENLRVLYLSPEFKAIDPNMVNTVPKGANGTVSVNERKPTGEVILAVSVNANTIVYDFSEVQPSLGTREKVVNAVELLTSLDAADNAKLYLYLMPLDAEQMVTSGLFLPDLVILPYEPTPTINPAQLMQITPIVSGGN